MSREIYLNAEKITNQKSMAKYMKKTFAFPDYFGGNLDALYDCLSEVDEETDVILDQNAVAAVCDNDYAYSVLMVMSRAAEDNPYLRILFR